MLFMKKISITVLFFDTELIQLKNGKVFIFLKKFTLIVIKNLHYQSCFQPKLSPWNLK
jgi:hypothetical protein